MERNVCQTVRHHSSPGRYGAYHTGRLCDGNGILTITAEDSQSGINFDAVYATDEEEKTVKPSHINKESGEITFPHGYPDSCSVCGGLRGQYHKKAPISA